MARIKNLYVSIVAFNLINRLVLSVVLCTRDVLEMLSVATPRDILVNANVPTVMGTGMFSKLTLKWD